MIYLILWIFIFGINVVPAFMPPTWTILAFFYIRYHLAFIPTVIFGATAATLGRVMLANLAKLYLRPVIPQKALKNYTALGDFLKKDKRLTIPLLFTYAFFPVPSNDVYITAGLVNLSLRMIAFAFFCGRLISYSFWVGLAYHTSKNLDHLFSQHLSKGWAFAGEFVGFGLIVLIGSINWGKVLPR